MSYRGWKTVRPPLVALLLTALGCLTVSPAFGQLLRGRRAQTYAQPVYVQAETPQPTQQVSATEEANAAAPISPSVSPGPMSLDACIAMGFEWQPSLAAARASLSSAQSGKSSVDRLLLPRLFMRDLGVRREQACYGVTIANAALTQAEWDTRYAITRNFFTVQYIRMQQQVVEDVLRNLNDGLTKIEKIVGSGDPNAKVTILDVRALKAQIALVKAKQSQAKNGMLKAKAALREAIGLAHDYPLDIAVVELPPAFYMKTVVKKKVSTIEFAQVYRINKGELIAAALANRGEMVQASAASRVAELEISAQSRIRGWTGKTAFFASDPHVQPIPQGIFNSDYRPYAIGPEAPANLVGRKGDRMQRASDLHQRSIAVVDKTTNLLSLDVEAQYLKWQEAAEEYRFLKAEYDTVQKLPGEVMKLLQNKDLTGGAIIQANVMAVTFRTQLNDALHIHALALAGLERATAGGFRVYPIPQAPLAMATKK